MKHYSLLGMITLLSLLFAAKLQAQNIGEKWRLNTIQVIDATENGTNTTTYSIKDSDVLPPFLAPEEFTLLSGTTLNYKRIGNQQVETLAYSKSNGKLEVELPECLLTLTVESSKNSNLLLTENKEMTTRNGKKESTTIIYSYSK